ncbi:MAG: neutral zinc metallopeptidase, partial [Actinobacteria bacterium]|nr:neutral zinc metallopeptidase [Actinomycetota bacterium]
PRQLRRVLVLIALVTSLMLLLSAYGGEAFAQGAGVQDQVKHDVSSVNAYWSQWFQEHGYPYKPAGLEFVSNRPIDSGCGLVYTMDGPLFCLVDQTFYYPLHWIDNGRPLASYGDPAVAWAVAHELGHNAQYQMHKLGIQRMDTMPLQLVELQADCFAGVAAEHTGMEPSGMKAVAAAAADSGGPDHGTSEQRMASFALGYDSGDPAQCLALDAGRGAGVSPDGNTRYPVTSNGPVGDTITGAGPQPKLVILVAPRLT